MERYFSSLLLGLMILFLGISCQQATHTDEQQTTPEEVELVKPRPEIYETVQLTTDLSQLSDSEREMLPLLIEAAKIMDGLFWQEAYPEEKAIDESQLDEAALKFFDVNYGPWDRLDGNKPFVEGVGAKPAGANFYPIDMTKEEFEAFEGEGKDDLYTFIRRDEKGDLKVIPYRVMFRDEVKKASDLLKQAAEIAEDAALKKYLTLRSEALLSDEYDESDIAWLDMKTNGIDCIIGPLKPMKTSYLAIKLLTKLMFW